MKIEMHTTQMNLYVTPTVLRATEFAVPSRWLISVTVRGERTAHIEPQDPVVVLSGR